MWVPPGAQEDTHHLINEPRYDPRASQARGLCFPRNPRRRPSRAPLSQHVLFV